MIWLLIDWLIASEESQRPDLSSKFVAPLQLPSKLLLINLALTLITTLTLTLVFARSCLVLAIWPSTVATQPPPTQLCSTWQLQVHH